MSSLIRVPNPPLRLRGRSSLARVSTAAVRIPREARARRVSSGPQIYVHEGARQRVERRLRTAFGSATRLVVTDNRHRMISCRRERGNVAVRLHLMFLDAPEPVLDAVVAYAKTRSAKASTVIDRFILDNDYRIRALRQASGRIEARGEVRDLGPLLARLDDQYFGGSVGDVLITWGRRGRRRGRARARRSIKLGSYCPEERLIRIHPALDARWVPRYFTSFIVYHELLHHLIPARRVGRRTLLHPPEFCRLERQFKHYERAARWEAAHIDRLLRS